jgi:hypothetical protein
MVRGNRVLPVCNGLSYTTNIETTRDSILNRMYRTWPRKGYYSGATTCYICLAVRLETTATSTGNEEGLYMVWKREDAYFSIYISILQTVY